MLKLVKAHFHKDRAVLSAFLMILVVATMLMHFSLMVARYDPMYEKNLKQRNISDSMFLIVGGQEAIETEVDKIDVVESYYIVDSIIPDMTNITVNSGKEKNIEGFFFLDENIE